jgi:error-prone DNA polymerase
MFSELLACSSFSFLRGASHPEELVVQAKRLNLDALAICDRDGLYGSVRAYTSGREVQQRVIVGAELSLRALPRKARPDTPLEDCPTLALLIQNHRGYENLCRLLTKSHQDRPKGESELNLAWLSEHHAGLVAIIPAPLCPGDSTTPTPELLQVVKDAFGERGFLAAHRHLDAFDVERTRAVREWSTEYGLEIIASARPQFHCMQRKPLADVMYCIRAGTTLDRAGTALSANSQAYLRSEADMTLLFPDHPAWIQRTSEIAQDLKFSMSELQYQFPCSIRAGETADSQLRKLTFDGLNSRYPDGYSDSIREQVEKELALIANINVAPYFLSTWEIVEMARKRRILCQGRGSAANSVVCYALGITAVDPSRSNLLFERFLSNERSEPPDIDIDFEHERREEIIQDIYEKYGRDRAAMVAEVICYRGKSALREVGKAFGLSLDQVDRLSGTITHWDSAETSESRLAESGFDARDSRLTKVVALARELQGFPRHLSIHVGGFVLSAAPLYQVAPVEPGRMDARTVVPWDKDDLEVLNFFKVDILGLGMLTAIRKCLALIHAGGGLRHHVNEPAKSEHRSAVGSARKMLEFEGNCANFERNCILHEVERLLLMSCVAELCRKAVTTPEVKWQRCVSDERFDPLNAIVRIPKEEKAVYDMVSRGDTVGVFQIESRAQMAMLPRLRPSRYYDLVIEVAIVRPGPIQGGMVHPYLKRRRKEEDVSYPHPSLKSILERTLGVPLFQEQVMQIAIDGAGYSGGEADQLRRDMAAWKKTGKLMRHRERLLEGFARKGISQEFGAALFEQIKGFGDYGFPESHAASFALLVYSSSWQKAHYPAHFACALINSQPMGFYSPATIIHDAQRHGVEVRDVDVCTSAWDCTLEAPSSASRIESKYSDAARALRLGLRIVKGFREASAIRLQEARQDAQFTSLSDVIRRANLRADEVEALAEAGAFESLEPGRRQAIWSARAPRAPGLFEARDIEAVKVELPALQPAEQLLLDYRRKSLAVADHPMCHYRQRLRARKVVSARELRYLPKGAKVNVAGVVICRQQPGTASGVVFITLEDETGFINLVLWSAVFQQFRQAARHSTIMFAQGEVEREVPERPLEEGEVIHVIVRSVERLDIPGRDIASASRDFH